MRTFITIQGKTNKIMKAELFVCGEIIGEFGDKLLSTIPCN